MTGFYGKLKSWKILFYAAILSAFLLLCNLKAKAVNYKTEFDSASYPDGTITPLGVVYNAQTDKIYMTSGDYCAIFAYSESDGTTNIFAGASSGNNITCASIGEVDGEGSQAQFQHPYGIAADSSGNLYVTDNTYIRKIDTNSGYVSSIFYNNLGTNLTGIAVYNSILYVLDPNNSRILSIDTSHGTIATPLTNPVDDGGQTLSFSGLSSITVDNQGNLYLGNGANGSIIKLFAAKQYQTAKVLVSGLNTSHCTPTHGGCTPDYQNYLGNIAVSGSGDSPSIYYAINHSQYTYLGGHYYGYVYSSQIFSLNANTDGSYTPNGLYADSGSFISYNDYNSSTPYGIAVSPSGHIIFGSTLGNGTSIYNVDNGVGGNVDAILTELWQ